MIDTMTPDEIVDRLGVSKSTVFAYLRQGVFPGALKERGTRWIVPTSDVAAFEAGKIKANGVFIESNVERAFAKWATNQGHLCIKMQDPSTKGAPDRMVLTSWGEVLFLEFKTPTGKVSPHQKKYHAKLKRCGFKVYVVRTVEQAQQIVGND